MAATFPALWTVQVETYRSNSDDVYGNAVGVWDAPGAPQPVYGWGPAGTQEVTGWRDVVTADVQLLAPPEFTCSPRDRIVLDGKTYEVQGDVQDFNHGPFGFAPGVVVNLKRIEGSQ